MEGFRLENVDMFYVHLEYFTIIWFILCSFGKLFLVLVSCTEKNLATQQATGQFIWKNEFEWRLSAKVQKLCKRYEYGWMYFLWRGTATKKLFGNMLTFGREHVFAFKISRSVSQLMERFGMSRIHHSVNRVSWIWFSFPSEIRVTRLGDFGRFFTMKHFLKLCNNLYKICLGLNIRCFFKKNHFVVALAVA
jgi:hypothetical protein